ncbi:MAG: YhjD/YihY/BrkB family envelope integrity protein [Eubacterium sp.]|nr:YhjD/YihY/BrkB family envelope integrity protein [Eubacterium sp.]
MKPFCTLKNFIVFFKDNWNDYNIINLAAQLSYRILLAFIPFIMLLYNFLSLIKPSLNTYLLNQAQGFLPQFFTAFFDTAKSGASGPQTSLWANLTFVFFMLFASVSAMRALILIINKAMHCKPPHPNVFLAWARSWFSALIYLILLLLAASITGALYPLTQTLATATFDAMNLSDWFIAIWRAFTLFYILTIVTLIFTAIYSLAPYPHLRFFEALPGGLTVTASLLLIWGLYRIGLRLPVTFEGINRFLQAPFILIVSIFVLSIITCLGCIVNAFFINLGKEDKKLEA